MRNALLVSVALLATLTSLVEAQQRVERGWALSPSGAVKIHNLSGRVHLIGWERDSIAVEGTLATGARFYGGGSRDGLKLGVEGDQSAASGASTLTIRLPRTANVAVRGAATEIEAEGLIGIVDLATVGGELRVSGSPRTLTAETMDGALVIRGSPNLLRARTASGSLQWEGSAADATLTTVDGTVRVQQGPFARLRIETISGFVTVEGALTASADLSIETHSGDVEVVLPRTQPVRISADAAQISGDRISTSERAAGQPGAPRIVDLNIATDVGVVAHLSVRSFKGQVRIRDR